MNNVEYSKARWKSTDLDNSQKIKADTTWNKKQNIFENGCIFKVEVKIVKPEKESLENSYLKPEVVG